ncbi:hypothetical protein H6785_02180 [Candidatus Nomurabacteria bacterium]|nr:hypothetical protein [Candidatus Kaiserbacteria bacterium]MCB9815361.1 hypothetical protein [Candidatus Nomurabacteria bacterium]
MDTKPVLSMEEYMQRQITGILNSEQIKKACCQELGNDSPTDNQIVEYGVTHGFSEEFSQQYAHQ